MRNILSAILALFFLLSFAQKNLPAKADFSSIINIYRDGNLLLGYKGKEGKRLKIVFTDAVKSKNNPLVYEVKGATLFEGKVAEFSGTMTLISFKDEENSQEYTNENGEQYHLKTGSFICDLKESGQNVPGKYEGNLTFYCGLNKKGELVEDDQSNVGDGYKNFLFKGFWVDSETGGKKPVNWGDSFLNSPIGFMGCLLYTSRCV